VTESLGKIGKGTSILFIGTAFGLFFNFLARVIIARFYTPADYGLFNLYYTILSIFSSIGIIGLKSGIQRNIAYYLGKDEEEKVPEIIGWGISIGLVGGVIFGIILFHFADPIAAVFSEEPALGNYFKLAAIAVPFYALLILLVSVFRGFQRTKEKILFEDLGKNTLILCAVIPIALMSLGFFNVILGASLSIILISISFFYYYRRNIKRLLDLKPTVRWDLSVGKKLMLFSLPLLFVEIMYRIMGWADTLMIGYFMAEDFVGYYQAAKPMSRFIGTPFDVAHFLYSPIAATLFAKTLFRENKIIFISLTKWICFGTLPLVIAFVFYPGWILDFFFGVEYSTAIVPLQILSVMYFINNFMGPNGATLTAFGRTKFLMYATGAAAGLNLIFNTLLIPYFGIVGAAVATAISIISVNVIRVKKLNDISGIHTIKPILLAPITLSLLLSVPLTYALTQIFPITIYLVIISVLIFYLIFFFSIIMTKSLSKDDIELLLLIEKRSGIDLSWLRKILKRFV